MIKRIAQPFNVIYRTENSVNKKIESIKDQIEFEKYKLRNKCIETSFFTEEESKDRLHKLERELEYYQTIIELKDDDAYIDGICGGEIIVSGTLVICTVIGLGIRILRK